VDDGLDADDDVGRAYLQHGNSRSTQHTADHTKLSRALVVPQRIHITSAQHVGVLSLSTDRKSRPQAPARPSKRGTPRVASFSSLIYTPENGEVMTRKLVSADSSRATVFDHYFHDKVRLGKGSYGVVYQATYNLDGKNYAVKVFDGVKVTQSGPPFVPRCPHHTPERLQQRAEASKSLVARPASQLPHVSLRLDGPALWPVCHCHGALHWIAEAGHEGTTALRAGGVGLFLGCAARPGVYSPAEAEVCPCVCPRGPLLVADLIAGILTSNRKTCSSHQEAICVLATLVCRLR
jgi:hypothetical protein